MTLRSFSINRTLHSRDSAGNPLSRLPRRRNAKCGETTSQIYGIFTLYVSDYYSLSEDIIGSTDLYVRFLDPAGVTLDNYRAFGSYAIYQADSNSDEDLNTYGFSAEASQALSTKLLVNLIIEDYKITKI